MFEFRKATAIQNEAAKAVKGGKVTVEVLKAKHCVVHVDTHGFHATVSRSQDGIILSVIDDEGAQVQSKTLPARSTVAVIVRELAEMLAEQSEPDGDDAESARLLADLHAASGGGLSASGEEFWWQTDRFSLDGVVTSAHTARMTLTGNSTVIIKIIQALKGDT